MSAATILIPHFRGMLPQMFRASFACVKEMAIAFDAPEKTVERWWRGETCPNAAQLLVGILNSDRLSAQVQALHDELKTRRTEINARLERLHATRARAVATCDRGSLHGDRRTGTDRRGMGKGSLRPALVTA